MNKHNNEGGTRREGVSECQSHFSPLSSLLPLLFSLLLLLRYHTTSQIGTSPHATSRHLTSPCLVSSGIMSCSNYTSACMLYIRDGQVVRRCSTHHSSLITHHSSLITHHSSLITHHSSLITHHSSLITHHSSLSTPLSSQHPSSSPHINCIPSHYGGCGGCYSCCPGIP